MTTKSFLKELSRLDHWINNFLLSPTFHKNYLLQTRQMKKLKEDVDNYIYFVCAFDIIDQQMYKCLKNEFLNLIKSCFINYGQRNFI